MIDPIDSSSARFLLNLARIHERAERVQRQIGSGLRVTAASDDPAHAIEILALHARHQETAQIRMNLGRVKAEVDTAEESLRGAVKALERALQLGVQGATGTQTAASRRSIATEVQAILESLVGIAATRVEGRYIFSGDTDWVQPYALDPGQPEGVGGYAGAASTREVTHPAGFRFRIAKSAQEIFSSAFSAVNALRVALENDQTAEIDAALVSLRSAQDHVNLELSFYGAVQNKVNEAISFASRLAVREQNQLSAIRDTDLAAAALELDQARIHQEAALGARVQLPRSTLFDFLG